jgi:type IV pilus assembly protein PilV
MSMYRRRDRGFSLLEVLVALLVFSLGLMGMAGLLLVSVKVNHGAYQRTQATAIAESMANRMRANLRAVWTNTYNGAYPRGGSVTACGPAAPCDSAAIAARDGAIWSQELANFLPNPAATITCQAAIAVPANTLGVPYDGQCTITLSWSESSLQQGVDAPVNQTFAWVFQP